LVYSALNVRVALAQAAAIVGFAPFVLYVGFAAFAEPAQLALNAAAVRARNNRISK
jgi:hypothetical protein